MRLEVDAIECGLYPRAWHFNAGAAEVARHLLHLSDGAAEAEIGDQRFTIAAPALLWLGDQQPGRLRLAAGSTGLRARIGDGVLVQAIGDAEGSVALRYLVDRDFSLSLTGQAEASQAIERTLGAALAEQRQPGEASGLLLSALLRLLLVSLLRISGGEEIGLPGIGERVDLLRRFRQLVEMNFRNHWPIGRYAQALGISPDRLHAICTGGIGKPPKALVSERLAHEAMLRLEHSSLTIEQLATSLGFADPAHFSSFFRKMAGKPPGQYRKAFHASRAGRDALNDPGFAEWP